jgi:hypothetical protein
MGDSIFKGDVGSAKCNEKLYFSTVMLLLLLSGSVYGANLDVQHEKISK